MEESKLHLWWTLLASLAPGSVVQAKFEMIVVRYRNKENHCKSHDEEIYYLLVNKKVYGKDKWVIHTTYQFMKTYNENVTFIKVWFSSEAYLARCRRRAVSCAGSVCGQYGPYEDLETWAYQWEIQTFFFALTTSLRGFCDPGVSHEFIWFILVFLYVYTTWKS